MRILINGLPLFGRRLAADLNETDPTSSFIFLDTYNSRWAQLRFMLLLPFADAVISMNGVTDNSGSLNAVLRWKKKLILQWQGTDVLSAMDRQKEGTMDRRYIDQAKNLVDSDWLFEEVSSLGVVPEYARFKSVPFVTPAASYSSIRVISYIAQQRQVFYGMERVLDLAVKFPEVQFDIYGTASTEFKVPANVRLHGWVAEETFKEGLRQAAIFLRLTVHEGFPVSVIEAMSYGCDVMMSMPYDEVLVARNATDTEAGFRKIMERVVERGLKPNPKMIEIARRDFDKTAVMKEYYGKIRSIVES